MPTPDELLRSAFDRARDAEAALRERRKAALSNEQRVKYDGMRREEEARQEQRDRDREQRSPKRLAELTLLERSKVEAEPRPRGAPPVSDEQVRERAMLELRRIETNERNAELKDSRVRLDKYLADCERERSRDRER